MHADALRLQGPLPVAIHRGTGEALSLKEWRNTPNAAIDPADLSTDQQIALVSARWAAAGWDDLVYGTEGVIGADRATREIAARTEMGQQLLAIGLRAIEMAREDALRNEEG